MGAQAFDLEISAELIGCRIRWLSQIYGTSVAQIAEYLQLESVQAVYHWLSGRSLPSLRNLYGLSCLWNISMDFLVAGQEKQGHISQKRAYLLKYCCFLMEVA